MSKGSANIGYWILALAVASIFAYLTFDHTTPNPIQKDAAQNTRAAYHLVQTGVIAGNKAKRNA